jgi:hypothetical protein
MSFIKKRAERFVQEYVEEGIDNADEAVRKAKMELYDIDDALDKSIFLQTILAANEVEYQEHLKGCKTPETCHKNEGYEAVSYYLNQELNRIGIRTNENQFTEGDKKIAEDKLEEILSEVKKIRGEQSEEFERIRKELEELKELYLLGKKNWYHLLLGKCTDWVVGGVISGAVSEGVIKLLQ